LVGNVAIEFNNFLVGLYPALFIYFLWLLILTQVFRKRIGNRSSSLKLTENLLFWSLFVATPISWVLSNFIYYQDIKELAPLNGVVFILYIVTLIKSWYELSKSILHFQNKDGVDKNSIWVFFMLFLFGPITIWFLQHHIRNIFKS
jgi:multisubunit Na+/H+ antiporter MnhE subunit